MTGMLASALALGIKHFLHRLLLRGTKELLVRLADGKEESLVVSANARASAITSALRETMENERLVLQTLRELASEGFQTRAGEHVDFIIEHDNRKTAIEVKYRLDRLSTERVRKYFDEEPGMSHIIILSTYEVPKEVLKQTRHLVESGMLRFARISDPERLRTDLRTALRSPVER